MPPKKVQKRATRASVTSRASESAGIQKRPKRSIHVAPPPVTSESPEPELPGDVIDFENSMETRFQEMDARLQVNEHALSDLSNNMTEVLQILRQPAQPTCQEAALSAPLSVSELQRPFTYHGPAIGANAQPSTYAYGYTPTGNNPHLPADILSRWDWVDAETVDNIRKGKFDLNNLPKLFREYTDRQAHTILTTDGVHLPTDGTQPYVVTTKTKLLSAFPNLARFLSAWTIYCSIRSVFAPQYAAGFYHWQERLVYRARVHKDWSDVLNYAIKYISRYQLAPPDAWFHPDTELLTECFIAGEKWLSAAAKSGRKHESFNSDICQN